MGWEISGLRLFRLGSFRKKWAVIGQGAIFLPFSVCSDDLDTHCSPTA